MNKEQIAVITLLFVLAYLSYLFLKKRFLNTSNWIKLNSIILVFGVLSAASITPFLYPYSFLKNLQVLTIIPLCTYNTFYLIDELSISFRIGRLAREIIAFFSILIGIIIGAQLINLLGISVFKISDIRDTLLIACACNTARMVLSYGGIIKVMRTNQNSMEIAKAKQAFTQSQLDVVYSKINPHFLYNTLNSIAGLALVDGKKTKDTTIALSKLLRYSLNYSGNNYGTLEEEAEIIQVYFELEKIRFEEKLNYEIHLPEEAKYYLVPRFLFQPLIENAVKHAFGGNDGSNFIRVCVSIVNKELVITIHDNGTPFPEKIITGYGLKNVNDKLQLLLPGKHEFEIMNNPEKQVKIIIKDLKKKDAN